MVVCVEDVFRYVLACDGCAGGKVLSLLLVKGLSDEEPHQL